MNTQELLIELERPKLTTEDIRDIETLEERGF